MAKKYIDAEKLIAEIEKRQEYLSDHNFHSMVDEYDNTIELIDSLQQERRETDGDDEKFVKILVRKEYAEQLQKLGDEIQTGQFSFVGAMNQQEQPEKTLTFDGFVDKVGTWFAQLRLDKFRKTFNGEIFPATQLVQEYDLFVRELSKTYSDKQEQSEVDLEKGLADYCRKYYNYDYPKQAEEGTGTPVMPHIIEAANYFYELGKNSK